jgi:ubiquinone/menaquinone biosynthesis C-methylase UbiE
MANNVRVVAGIVALVLWIAAIVVWPLLFHAVPIAWTGEAARLTRLLAVSKGSVVADIGAGGGGMAAEMARSVGPSGRVYASELSDDARKRIAARALRLGPEHAPMEVVAAQADGTNLPPACCDAIYLRNVFHHIDDADTFAAAIVEALRPAARVAIIDFPPGALPFHGDDHGVGQAAVVKSFEKAGVTLEQRIDRWGGGMYLLLFRRADPEHCD